MSIDVTYRCNFGCPHCYLSRQDHTSELSAEEWVALLQKMKSRGKPLFICGWFGGEPLLRPEVIEASKSFFKCNIIFTNGTMEFPSWPDCTFVVSVPGTKTYYKELTGANESVYDLVKDHANRPDLNLIASFCITRKNVSSILSFLLEWQNDTKIKGVFFEFHTPRMGEGKELWLDWPERDCVIDTLVELKTTYGDFIYNTFQMLDLMRSQSLQDILLDCPFTYVGLGLDPMGHPKFPCTIGPEADCDRCGCILPVFSSILYKRGWLIRAFVEGIQREFRERRKKGRDHVRTGQ